MALYKIITYAMSNLCLTYVMYVTYIFCYLFLSFYISKYVFEISFFAKVHFSDVSRFLRTTVRIRCFTILFQQETIKNHNIKPVCDVMLYFSACGFSGIKPHSFHKTTDIQPDICVYVDMYIRINVHMYMYRLERRRRPFSFRDTTPHPFLEMTSTQIRTVSCSCYLSGGCDNHPSSDAIMSRV